MTDIDGQTLIGWGFKPGRGFKAMINTATALRAEGVADEAIVATLRTMAPSEVTMRTSAVPYGWFLDLDPMTDAERGNAAAVTLHMGALMRLPTVRAGAVMPDACPSGSQLGTIPVGGVVACEKAIHTGFHSADICCSLAVSLFDANSDPKQLLDAVESVTHFGGGGRDGVVTPPPYVMAQIDGNPFTAGLENLEIGHFASQGDGNHFASVGRLASSGALALVTHHGSRGFGAQVYRRGMAAAKRDTATLAPTVPSHNAWIDADSHDGEAYWDALQIVRSWTRGNHFALHDLAAKRAGKSITERFWNEHNFVFRKSDGLFYHGKGATPNWRGFAADDSGLTLIPLNMAEPILVVRHRAQKEALGFAPHGAGRNLSRTQLLRADAATASGNVDDDQAPVTALARELAALRAKGLDIRAHCGKPDLSELPSAYKNAASVRTQIERFHLGEIVDEILPYGSIMAGDWQASAPWRKRGQSRAADPDGTTTEPRRET